VIGLEGKERVRKLLSCPNKKSSGLVEYRTRGARTINLALGNSNTVNGIIEVSEQQWLRWMEALYATGQIRGRQLPGK